MVPRMQGEARERGQAGEDGMSELTIRVPWTPPSGLGVNAHKHWRTKHGPEQEGKQAAILATKSTMARKRWTCPDMPVLVAVIHWEKKSRKKDADNALNACKWIADGVCEALQIDDRRFITSMAFQRVDPDRQGFVDIIIRPATVAERRLAS